MPLTRQNDAQRSARVHIAATLALGALLITGCGEGAADEPGSAANEPALSAPSDPTSGADTSSPEPEATIEPATGPVMKVEAMKSSSQLRLPEGYGKTSSLPMSASGYDRGAELAGINLYAFVNTAYPADTDELARLWKGRGRTPFGPPARRQPDEIVDGTYALHLSGPGEYPGEFVELYQVISADFEERVQLSFTFEKNESVAERREFIEPVLATWTFSW